ncbi:CoA-disulfide reductase [bacterium]|nr:CoA-disulfide reductase [bacterium]
MPKNFVIIGGNGAGMSAASKIRRLSPEANLVVFEKGEHISVAACGLPYWIAGVVTDDQKLQVMTPQIAREKRGIDVRILHEVTQIDPQNNRITVRNLEKDVTFAEPYDALLIATGARAIVPPIPGIKNEGVFTLRSLADGQRIHDYSHTNRIQHVTIIGAGYIGLEMAEAFRYRNIEVSLVEMADQIVPAFDKDIIEQVKEHIINKGVELNLEARVSSIEKTDAGLLVKTSIKDIQTDMVLVSTGVRPNSELASHAGITLGKSGGITVNSFMQTNFQNIYSAGDCAEHHHLVLNQNVWIPLAPSANKGGRIAGENMAGQKNQFPGIIGTAVAKVFDYIIAQTGLTEKQAKATAAYAEIEAIIVTAGSRSHYYPGSTPITIKLVVEKSSKRLLGAQMIGTSDVAKRLDVFATAITAKMTVGDIGMLDLSYAPPVAPVYDPIHVTANVANK